MCQAISLREWNRFAHRVIKGMQKRVVMIHGWGGTPDEGWRPWLKHELEKREFLVHVPAMPDTMQPKMQEWVAYLAKIVHVPDTDCFLVGHSLGVVAILRYLATLEGDQKICGAILIAGFTYDLGIPELSNFFKSPMPWEKIKKHCSKFVVIHSDNDPVVPFVQGEILRDKLGSEYIVVPNMRHFSGDDGITEAPVILETILHTARV